MFVDMEKGLRPFDPAYVHVHGAADILHVSAVVVLVEIDGHSRDKNRCRFVRGRVRRVNRLGRDTMRRQRYRL